MPIPKRVAERISAGIKRFQPVLASAKTRDVGESDTVVIVQDMLQEIFGYDKYADITSEFQIKCTFCDLAIKVDGKVHAIIEVKAIGSDLKDNHVKQAVDYAANQGVDWVVLTNGENWRIYRVNFTKPIDADLIADFTFKDLNARNEECQELLFSLSKEGWNKSALGELHERKQVLSRFYIGAVLLSEPILDVIRRELRRSSPNVKIDNAEIKIVLENEVIKRDVLEGDKALTAKKQTQRNANKALRAASEKSTETDSTKTQEVLVAD